MTPAQRAVSRIREEMDEQQVSQRDLARELKCSQGRIQKLLNGGVHLRINDVGAMADALHLRLSEVVRDRGLEFSAELTPTRVRILQELDRRPELEYHLLGLLNLRQDASRAVPKSTKRGRPLPQNVTKKHG